MKTIGKGIHTKGMTFMINIGCQTLQNNLNLARSSESSPQSTASPTVTLNQNTWAHCFMGYVYEIACPILENSVHGINESGKRLNKNSKHEHTPVII